MDETTTDLGSKAGAAVGYFSSPTFQSDRAEGKVFCLTGDAALRYPLFRLVAKSFAFSDLGTYLTSLHKLVYMIEDEDGGRQKLEKVANLFIDDFEKTFRNTDDFPYTHRERINIEEFVKARQEAGKATYFSTSVPWSQLKWWSTSLVEYFTPIVIDVEVGR